MPTYEYKCTECSEHFEISQTMSEDTLTSLPGPDHEHQLKKVFKSFGIAFKGSGFYKNDSRSSSDSSSSAGSTSNGKSETDTKPDSKSPTKVDAPKVSSTEAKKPSPKKSSSKSD